MTILFQRFRAVACFVLRSHHVDDATCTTLSILEPKNSALQRLLLQHNLAFSGCPTVRCSDITKSQEASDMKHKVGCCWRNHGHFDRDHLGQPCLQGVQLKSYKQGNTQQSPLKPRKMGDTCKYVR